MPTLDIDADIARAKTPLASLYTDPAWHDRIVQHALLPGWHVLPERESASPEQNAVPVHPAGEPMLHLRDADGTARLVSNACTHRGALLLSEPCQAKQLVCPYHRRSFRLDGSLLAAPGFAGAADFPRPCDDLPRGALGRFGPWHFGSPSPKVTFDLWFQPLAQLLPAYPWSALRHVGGRDYPIEANWLLYLENYLEGFHIPSVHPELNALLDPRDYRLTLNPHGALQLGVARDPAHAFPTEYGAAPEIAAFYLWMFPSTLVNVYPWGVSLNLILPQGHDRCIIRYRTYFLPDSQAPSGAGADLDLVEQQDQAIVLRCQAGLRARLYGRGRYSPTHELAVHHLHRLLDASLQA